MSSRFPLTDVTSYAPTPSSPFDEHYVDRLRGGCAVTAAHFSGYFSLILNRFLRRYVRQTDLIDDIRQETLLRVLQITRREDFRPQRFEAFVLGTARLVSFELMRTEHRYCAPAENTPEPADTKPTPEAFAMDQAFTRTASETLAGMEGRDGRILRMIALEDADRTEICQHFGLSQGYLRVVIHRARTRFSRGAVGREGLLKAA